MGARLTLWPLSLTCSPQLLGQRVSCRITAFCACWEKQNTPRWLLSCIFPGAGCHFKRIKPLQSHVQHSCSYLFRGENARRGGYRCAQSNGDVPGFCCQRQEPLQERERRAGLAEFRQTRHFCPGASRTPCLALPERGLASQQGEAFARSFLSSWEPFGPLWPKP